MRKTRSVALITGGSRGIGRAIVTELARRGYVIAFAYRQNRTSADALCRELRKRGATILSEQQDVADFAAVSAFVGRVLERFGHVDILVNNAGVLKDTPLYLMEESEWDEVIGTNLKGLHNFCRACVPHMMRRKRGWIINISSTAGLQGVPGQTNYCASKGGIISFSRALAREVACFGITVNAIAPGYIETAMVKRLPKEQVAELRQRVPLGRFGQPAEVAKLVRFLIEEGDYITGQTIVIDGGLLA